MPVRKPLPIWVWALAAGAGLLIGFFVLRPGKAAAETPAEESEAGAIPRASAGGASAAPIPPDLLEALGLTPPSYDFGDGGGGGEEGYAYTADGYRTESLLPRYRELIAPLRTEPYYQQAREILPVYRTESVFSQIASSIINAAPTTPATEPTLDPVPIYKGGKAIPY